MYLTQNRQGECFNFILSLTAFWLFCLESFLYYYFYAEVFIFSLHFVLERFKKPSLLKIHKRYKFGSSQGVVYGSALVTDNFSNTLTFMLAKHQRLLQSLSCSRAAGSST